MNHVEAMKQALEALESYHGYMEPLTTVFGGPRVPAEQSTTRKVEKAITSLRQSVAELEKQQFNPDWDVVAVMTEEVQRMAKRIEELEAEKQEPLAWYIREKDLATTDLEWVAYHQDECEPLYTNPQPKREWVGLTDVEWMNIVNKDQAWFGQRPDEVAHEVAKLVEAKLKEKNT